MEIKIVNDLPLDDELPIVCNKKYLSIFSEQYGWVGGYENNQLYYLIPFIVKKKFIFQWILLQSETIFFKNAYNEKIFLNSLVNFFKKTGKYDFIAQPPTHVVFNTYPDGAIYAPFGSYVIDLNKSEDSLWNKIHSKHKNVIRKAIKSNVRIIISQDIFNDVYDLIYDTLLRNNLGMIKKRKLLDILHNMPENILVIGSYLDNIIQTGAIIIYNKLKAYYFWGGSINKPSLGANNLLHWEAIKYLKGLGVKEYDFVGARIEPKDSRLRGIQRFKKRFGADLKQGYLWKYSLNKYKYILYNRLYKLLKNKQGDIIDQEKNNFNI